MVRGISFWLAISAVGRRVPLLSEGPRRLLSAVPFLAIFLPKLRENNLLKSKKPSRCTRMKLRARWRLPQLPALLARQDIPTGIPSDINTDPPLDPADFTTTVVVTVPPSKPTVTKTTTTSKVTVTKMIDEVTVLETDGEEVTVTKTNRQTVETDVAPTADSDGATHSTALPDSSDNSGGSSLSGGAIAGIVIGVIALLLILAALVFWRRRRQRQALVNAECPPKQAGVTDEKILDDRPFPRWNGGGAQLDSSGGVIAEVDGATAERGPSELPTSPVAHTPAGGLVRQDDPGVKATLSPMEGGTEGVYVNSWSSYRDGPGPQGS